MLNYYFFFELKSCEEFTNFYEKDLDYDYSIYGEEEENEFYEHLFSGEAELEDKFK
jgi:hypothetical protein